jgi:hypothetical protein
MGGQIDWRIVMVQGCRFENGSLALGRSEDRLWLLRISAHRGAGVLRRDGDWNSSHRRLWHRSACAPRSRRLSPRRLYDFDISTVRSRVSAAGGRGEFSLGHGAERERRMAAPSKVLKIRCVVMFFALGAAPHQSLHWCVEAAAGKVRGSRCRQAE